MKLLGSFDMFVAICDDAGIIIYLFIYLFNEYLKDNPFVAQKKFINIH